MKVFTPAIIVLFIIALSGIPYAQPSGPFTNDADTYFLMHLDGPAVTLDDGPNVLSATFSQVAGTPDPAFAASQSGFGQCLYNSVPAAAVQGIICSSGEISEVTGPITYEAWINVPQSAGMVTGIADRAAGRMVYYFYYEDETTTTHSFIIYNASSEQQVAYVVMNATLGWTWDEWHHVAWTYDVSRTGAYDGNPSSRTPAEFYFDGVKMPISWSIKEPRDEFGANVVGSYPGLFAGRPWPPLAPGHVLHHIRGYFDEFRFSTVDRYEPSAPPRIWILDGFGQVQLLPQTQEKE